MVYNKLYFDDGISALSEQVLYWKNRADSWEYDAHSFYNDIVLFQEFIHRKDVDKKDIKILIDEYVNSLSN